MILDVLTENSWEEETAAKIFSRGEDSWFSQKMEARGAKLPTRFEASHFACQTNQHLDTLEEPFGFHKVHKKMPHRLPEIAEWCPEIALASPGDLADAVPGAEGTRMGWEQTVVGENGQGNEVMRIL